MVPGRHGHRRSHVFHRFILQRPLVPPRQNSMSRRTRPVQRLLKEQDTVGAQRAERKEQEELAGKKKKLEAALTKTQRMGKLEEREKDIVAHPPRIARVGKPLRR